MHDDLGEDRIEFWNECEHKCKFDFATLQPEQLAQILDSNPTRALDFPTRKWTAEQSVVLASRPYPLNLTLGKWLTFEDEGKTFGTEETPNLLLVPSASTMILMVLLITPI
jgi:hypothetical protein